MEWHDAAVQAALIESVGSLVATTIAAVCASLIGQSFVNRKRLQERLKQAQLDIAFLLAVEQEHCELHKAKLDQSYKLRVRSLVQSRGFVWSGENTPGRIKK
jgi:type II secretory pathway pseudopilin PulG